MREDTEALLYWAGEHLKCVWGDHFWLPKMVWGGTTFGKGGPLLAAKSGLGGPVLVAKSGLGGRGPVLVAKSGPGDHFWAGPLLA